MGQAIEGLFDAALRHHQAGQLTEAEQLYRQVLAINSSHADSLHCLGAIACRRGDYDAAADLIGRAIRLNGNVPLYHYNLGLTFSKQGIPAEAIACYQRALAVKPDFAEACNNLGALFLQQGRLDEAAACCERAVIINPNFAEACNNLGTILARQRRFDKAAPYYKRALAIRPDYAEAHYNLGRSLDELGLFDQALACYKRALAIKTDYAEAHYHMGAALYKHGRLREAEASYERALAINPDFAEACNNLGAILHEQGRLDEAVAYCERALAINPDYAEACNNLGTIFAKQRHFDKAVACCQRALAIRPDYAGAHYNLGCSYEGLGRLEEALACYNRALAARPDYAEAQFNIGAVLYKQGKFNDAMACCERALAVNPNDAEAHQGKAFIHLLSGGFGDGWRELEWRGRLKHAKSRDFASPAWNGSDVRGKTLLLHCEQGLGDSIQFIRYSPAAKQKCGRLLLSCPLPLARLFKGVQGIDEIFTDDQSLPAHDYHVPLMSLPGLFGTTVNDIPSCARYLTAEPTLAAAWRNRLADLAGFRVGVIWRGNPAHKNDRQRSMSPAQFGQFLDLPGLSVVSLQKDGAEEEIRELGMQNSFLNAGPDLTDFADTAALLTSLDLVITVDTSVCHLAGAMGVPVWTLLPFVPDWRWLLGRNDSPWYPAMRLFRQPAIGDWQSVLGQVRAELKHMLEDKKRF